MRDDVQGLHIICNGCGETAVGLQQDPTDIEPSEHCSKCPPWICEDCGENCSMTSPCSCWISLKRMAMADIKALFAKSDISIDPQIKE